MITIVFEAHGTTFDNENHLASGHFDVALSPLGEKQAKELRDRYKDKHFDAIFCSDLQRSYKDLLASKNLAFLTFVKNVKQQHDYWINEIDLKTLVTTPFKWQPGWNYQLTSI